jgi:flagellar protein FlaG
MVGNVTPVTTASAGTSAPSVPRVEPAAPAASGGKAVAPAGEVLPVAPEPVDVAKAIERLNDIMSSKQRSLRFRVDEGSGRTIITVINEETGELIRQIPPEELLAVAQQLEDIGTLIDARI